MPGDSGIFATCNKGREKKCVGELRDLFSEYATQLYGNDADGDDDDEDDGGATSIENDIQAELAGIQKPATAQLFVPVKLEVQCGEFFEGEEGGFVYFVFPSFPLPCARFNTPTQQQKTKIMKNPRDRQTNNPPLSPPQWFSSKQSPQSSPSVSCRRSARTRWRSPCASVRGRPRGWRR